MADISQIQLPNGEIYNLKANAVDDSKLPLAGGAMTGEIQTSFKSAVANGSYQAVATTVPNLCEELRYSSGAMGSANITTAYTLNSITVPTGWYNFLWIPHRSGGKNGLPVDDNCNFGALFLLKMTTDGGKYIIRYTSSAIKELIDIASVTQSYVTASGDYPLLLANSANGITETAGVKKNNTAFFANPATGELFARQNHIIKNTSIDAKQTNNGLSSANYTGMYIKDKNGLNIGKSAVSAFTDGAIEIQMYAQAYNTSGSSVGSNSLTLKVDKNGVANVSVSHADKWRSALGLSEAATRAITNMTSKSYITYNTNLMTTNTLAYWNGSYNSSNASNLNYLGNNVYFGNQAHVSSENGQSFLIYAGNSTDGSTYKLHFGVADSSWGLRPSTNNALDCGTSGHRWNRVYAANGSIQTSDRTKKKDIEPLNSNLEKLFEDLKPVQYKMIDGTSGRTHVGFVSQDVEESMTELGMTGLDFAGFCKDPNYKDITKPEDNEVHEIEDGTYNYSLCYEEFIALNTHMIQKLMKRIDELEARVAELEGR